MTTISNISSKYKDIISKSVLLHSGSPAVYQLKPKKEKIGTVTRKTVGEKSLNKINKTILLVGETGTGKSTLINALVNYTIGVKFEDNIWFEIVEREKRSQSESQTSDVIMYEIFGFEDQTLPYSLTIIDTPGYGDTRGIEHDLIISQRLFDLFRSDDGVHEINAVGLVMKASDNRVSDRLRYIFNSVTSLFGKDLEKNIVTLITNSNGTRPTNVLEALEVANIKCAKNKKNQPLYFQFDNCQSTERTEEEEDEDEDEDKVLEKIWSVTERGMKRFSSFLETSTPQKLTTTVEVLNRSVRLTACIHNLQERITFMEKKQKEIQQIQEALRAQKAEMKNNENFTIKVDEVYKDKQTIKDGMWGLWFYEGAVCCTVCEENCHHPNCTMAWYPKDCEVMKGGRCTSCTGKCPVSDHVKENWIYVTKTRRVQKTQEDVKKRYEKNKSESEKKLSLLENLEKEMRALTAEKNQWLEESYQHVLKLEEIALNVNSLSTYVHLDFLIEKMMEKGDKEKVQKLEEMRSRQKSDKSLMAAAQYTLSKFWNIAKKKLFE